jgi:glucosamine--fructose-6-phosphate aminotransferase (isomerizing)
MPDSNLASTPYVRDILAQPEALENTLTALTDRKDLRALARRLASGRLRQVVLTGMGSSYHGLYPLQLALLSHGLFAVRIETSELIHHAPELIAPHTLLIAVSQSGRSAETLRLLDQVRGRAPLIAVTNTAGSPLAEQADAVLLTHAGEEASVSCKTYVCALAALIWLGDVLADRPLETVFSSLAKTPAAMRGYLERCPLHVGSLVERLAGIQHLILVGRGSSLAAVDTAGLIIKEAARFPAEGMSSAAFRHGPLEMTSPRQFVVIYANSPQTAGLEARLVEDIRAAGGQAALVRESPEADVFCLPAVEEAVRPILEILPAQIISLALAQIQGLEAGRFTFAHKVTTTE